jgi:multicomponent K+:H+ antiporter subunit D
MSHLALLPVLLPLLTGAALLLLSFLGLRTERTLALISTAALLPVALFALSAVSEGDKLVYYTGAWPAPFGIVLVLDRLSALMLTLTAVLAIGAVGYACASGDDKGARFHALFQFALVGVNGAFLTGDLFNLFVCFELLLIASYALLASGNTARRTRAGLHLVALNLAGSAVFLFAVGLIYAGAGTLNLADLAMRIPTLEVNALWLTNVGGVLLLVVFGLKAAAAPLGFWLVPAYSVALASVAALFAIMTKVGLYAIVRVHGLMFGLDAGPGDMMLSDWLMPAAVITVTIGTVGVFSSASLARLVACSIVVSAGTLMIGLAIGTEDSIAAALYYLLGSTTVAGSMFLMAGAIAMGRGAAADDFTIPAALPRAGLLGSLFFCGAIAAAGLPPLAGFAGKLWLLSSAMDAGFGIIVVPLLLISTVFISIALARAASALFWRTGDAPAQSEPVSNPALLAISWLVLGAIALMVFAHPIGKFAELAAADAIDRVGYSEAVFANDGTVWRALAEGK